MQWQPLIFFTTALSLIVATPPDQVQLPDVRKGEIDGRVAVMAWPASGVHDGKVDKLIPADNCHAHLTSLDSPDEELTYACGVWFQPPAGRYRIWLEKGNLISHQGVIIYSPDPFDGRGMAGVHPVAPGGRVALDDAVQLPASASLRLINIDSCRHPEWVGRLFQRRSTPESAHAGLLMPAGRVVVTLFDRTNDALALGRPVGVQIGKTVKAAPRPPKDGADVLAILQLPRISSKPNAGSIDITIGGKKPDVFVDSAEVVIAMWYDLKPGRTQLAVTSKTMMFSPRDLTLIQHRVVTIRGDLTQRPSVHVSINAPQKGLDTLFLEARRRGERTAIRHVQVHPGDEALLDHLPAEPLEIVLVSTPWEFRKRVDLSRGIDESVSFDLHPIIVSGTVYYGRDPAPRAEVRFEANDGWIVRTTDSEGHYEATLWRADDAYLAEVVIPARAGPPFEEGFIQINGDRLLDFKIPRTHYVVHVADASSGKPVSGAKVAANNLWLHPSGNPQNIVQTVVTGDDGTAELAPLRAGDLTVHVRATGYHDSDGQRRQVNDQTAEGTIDVRLQSVGETTSLRLLLPDGSPAAAAEAWAVRAADGHELPLWRGNAGTEGVLAVPNAVNGALLLVRHRAAGSVVRAWRAEEATWNLPRPSPLVLDAGRGARVALWIGDRRVSGVALSFLAWSYEAADRDGIWSGENLPAQALRVIAWRGANETQIASGAFDGQAEPIAYPWSTVVTVRPVN